MLKSLLGNSAFQFLVGKTIGFYMLLVGWTTRWRRVNAETVERIWRDGGGLVACIWHGRFMLVHTTWKFDGKAQKAKFLISASREGGVVTHASRTVGADVIRGSAAKGKQSKGGFEALREMKRHTDAGGIVGMTPDGPRGPRMRAKLGPIQLAKLAGVPLLPLVWSTKNRIVMSSWDRFVFPLPFGRGTLVWGNPISVPRDADNDAMEAARAALEAEMIRITNEADRLCGAPIIEPDAPRGQRAAETPVGAA